MSVQMSKGGLLAAAAVVIPLLSSSAEAYRLLVSNEKDNTVTVLAGDTLDIIKTVPVGARPRGMALSPDGGKAYICTSDANHIEILDLASLSLAGTLPSGKDPEYFALSPDGKTLYVANEDDNLVTVVDIPLAKVVAEIPVGVEPEGMAVSPNGATVVATSARALRVPAPSLLVVAGLLVAVVPGVPRVQVPPDAVGLVVLPPLLYAAGQDLPWRELKPVLRPVSILAVGLVAASAAAVTAIAVAVTPLPWPLASLLLPALPCGVVAIVGLTVGATVGLTSTWPAELSWPLPLPWVLS